MPNFPVEKKQQTLRHPRFNPHTDLECISRAEPTTPGEGGGGGASGEEVEKTPSFLLFFLLPISCCVVASLHDRRLTSSARPWNERRTREANEQKKTRHHPLPCELRESGSLFFEFHQRPKDVPPPLLFFLQVGTSSPPLLFLFSRASFSILEFQRPLLPSRSFKIDHFRLTALEPLAKLFFPAPPKTISQYTPSAINRDFWEIPNRRITAPPPPLLRTCVALSHSHTTAAEAAAMEPPNQAKGTGSAPPPPPFSAGFVAYSATPSLRLPAPYLCVLVRFPLPDCMA